MSGLKMDVKDKDGKLVSSTVILDGSDSEPTGDPSENEKFYDEKIAPELLKLGKLCKKRNMGILASVSYEARGDDAVMDYGSTQLLSDKDGFPMRMIQFAIASQGNIDKFLGMVERDAKKSGTNLRDVSIYFRLMKQIEE